MFGPGTRKDEYPVYLYDIMDIEEFVKRYPVQVLYTKEHPNADELYEQLDKIKDKTTKGFIETRKIWIQWYLKYVRRKEKVKYVK